ncbi:MAG: M48 family metallopeptidase [Elusimicrobiaceae bacterium]|jgi:metalloendopeptidase OMA1, mitochondrial|nr:M48 family metallopeptidase [Elusimicrobiaceae bacterium]MBT3955646.1 M48 family metallopeptidase [Elusimicrobiaceae bacterium]MBT4008517.1 M48 family metallopeptidase [Elusimicrobiaceae bacterium]MBT4403405.1 M48 family metallopeptidase [Elusimicrobiaceae bacterium]MBT4439706.1 M48 family metallopeptidase [Elusimicrobiaceae bacterium]
MRKLLLTLFLSILFIGCATTPMTDRKQVVFISTENEIAMGEEAFREVLATSTLSTDKEKIAMVERVGHRLAAQVDADFNWEFALIESDQINAFCLPGGKVGIYTGILDVTETEDGLAVVMGHEIAHAIARHGAERMSQNMILGLGAIALGLSTDSGDRAKYLAAYGVGSAVVVALPYSRKHEYEADYIGLILMAKAGYDPNEAVTFWQRMSEAKGGGGSNLAEFISTHPADDNRIEKLEAYMPEAMNYYKASIHR